MSQRVRLSESVIKCKHSSKEQVGGGEEGVEMGLVRISVDEMLLLSVGEYVMVMVMVMSCCVMC